MEFVRRELVSVRLLTALTLLGRCLPPPPPLPLFQLFPPLLLLPPPFKLFPLLLLFPPPLQLLPLPYFFFVPLLLELLLFPPFPPKLFCAELLIYYCIISFIICIC